MSDHLNGYFWIWFFNRLQVQHKKISLCYTILALTLVYIYLVSDFVVKDSEDDVSKRCFRVDLSTAFNQFTHSS